MKKYRHSMIIKNDLPLPADQPEECHWLTALTQTITQIIKTRFNQKGT